MDNENKGEVVIEDKGVFSDLVGLENTKRKLNFYLKNYRTTNTSPNLLLYSSKGNGKSTVGRKYALALTQKGNRDISKKLLEINCSTLGGIDSFFNEIVNPHLIDSECTIFLDEAEAISNELSLAFCTILNPNKENRNTFSYAGNDYIFDFSRLSFIFASTEIQKIHHALLDRLTVIDFDEYKVSDLARIIKNNLIRYQVNNELLEKIASYVRGNPRHAQKMSNDIVAYLQSKDKIDLTNEDWSDIVNELGLNELGLTNSEIKVLQILKENPSGSSLTKVASILGSTVENTRKFVEIYPMKLGLFEVKPAIGRVLTSKGYELINKL